MMDGSNTDVGEHLINDLRTNLKMILGYASTLDQTERSELYNKLGRVTEELGEFIADLDLEVEDFGV